VIVTIKIAHEVTLKSACDIGFHSNWKQTTSCEYLIGVSRKYPSQTHRHRHTHIHTYTHTTNMVAESSISL